MTKNVYNTVLLLTLLIFTILFMLWAFHALEKSLIAEWAPLPMGKYCKAHL